MKEHDLMLFRVKVKNIWPVFPEGTLSPLTQRSKQKQNFHEFTSVKPRE